MSLLDFAQKAYQGLQDQANEMSELRERYSQYSEEELRRMLPKHSGKILIAITGILRSDYGYSQEDIDRYRHMR